MIITQENIGVQHIEFVTRYETQREIPVVIHNGSNYDFHFLINELAKKFRANMKCIGENTGKSKSFSVPIKITNDEGKVILYRLKFIDSMGFMNSSLSSLTDNLADINTVICKSCLEKSKLVSSCYHVANEKID